MKQFLLKALQRKNLEYEVVLKHMGEKWGGEQWLSVVILNTDNSPRFPDPNFIVNIQFSNFILHPQE